MYTRYPEAYCAAFKNIPSKGVGAKIRNPCQMEESHSFPISPLVWHREMGCKHIPWAFLADTATLYLYPTGWWHIAEVFCTLLQTNICFMELEHLVGKKNEENRARACIRICVMCMFYKLSIGGFRMSAHFFSFYLSGSHQWKLKKSLGCEDWRLRGPNVLARSLEHLYFDS